MLARFLPQPLLSVALLVVWLLAHNAASPGLVLLGLLLAVAIPLMTRRFWPEYPRRVRYGPLLRLMGVVIADIVLANLRVALLILGPPGRLRPGFLTLPLRVRSPHAITMLAGIISLTPGTVSANLSGDGRTLLVHGLDLGDPAAKAERIRSRYERPLLEVFEC
ncbi:Na+/H+ antiporter subunit E [soil metagenome]